MTKSRENFDIIIIGGGFYGCVLALFFKKYTDKIAIIEKKEDLLFGASYNNQARIHNGYHYPRSFLTALRSHNNYLKFIKDWEKAVKSDYKQYYAIASTFSKTTARQFYKFCNQLGSPAKPAPEKILKYFNKNLIEDVFETDEVVFDAGKMRQILEKELKKQKISVFCNSQIIKVQKEKSDILCISKDGKTYLGKKVFNCTYSGINDLLNSSNLPVLAMKEEFIEMPIITVPKPLDEISVTVLDGPFFGFLPFPNKNAYSFWHVRYAIRANWVDPSPPNLEAKLKKIQETSYWPFMIKDAQRYIPLLKESKYLESIYEIKTVLVDKEESDGRPILYRKDYGLKNLDIIMGGKIDNIYDIIEKIKEEKA